MINKDFLFYNTFKHTTLKKNNTKTNNIVIITMLISIIILSLIISINILFGQKILQNKSSFLKTKELKKRNIDSIPKQPREKWKYMYELKNDT
ncbi:MAG: hypothetical protein U0T57_02685 [Buchnera aphidicola (Kaburagia rhusicola rhusicola)]